MIETNVIITGIFGILSTITTYIFTKRKYNAEVNNALIKNMEQSLQFYMKLSDDNKERLNSLQLLLDKEQKNNITLKNEIEVLKVQVDFLSKYNCMRINCKKRICNIKDENIDRDNV